MILSNRTIIQNVMNGIDFVMYMLPNTDYPRTVLVGSTIRHPYTVLNRDDVLMRYKVMLYEDCYINAYPNYDWMIEKGRLPPTYRPPPNHLMIDLDRASFTDEQEFQQAVSNTISNIKASITGITGEYPIVIDSGNGYHIHLPMPGLTSSFENVPELEAFWQQNLDLDNKFLRFLERRLSNGKADQRHNPSIKSCMFRVPGTINSKAKNVGKKDPTVKIVNGDYNVMMKSQQPASFTDSKPTNDFLNDFHAYLVQEAIEDKLMKSHRRQIAELTGYNDNTKSQTSGTIGWIDQLLQTGVEDNRKNLLFWVLAPYLITVRGLDYDRVYGTLDTWLDKCNEVRRLEPCKSAFQSRMEQCLDVAKKQERKPIRFETFKEYYPEVYNSLKLVGRV